MSHPSPEQTTETLLNHPVVEWYQIFFEQAADGIFIANAERDCIAVNQQGYEMLGYTHEEILNLSVRDLVLPDELARHPQLLVDLHAGKTILGEYCMRCKDGRFLPVEISARKLSNGNFLAIVRDVSKRKQTERELQRSNNLLRAIIEAAPAAIVGLDLEGNVQTVWNPAAERMLGWRAQEVMGRPMPSVPTEAQEEFKSFRETMRNGLTLDGVEVERQRRDGRSINYSIYASPVRDPDNQIIGNIAIMVDITERKQAEQSIALMSFALDNVHEAAFLLDENARFHYVNEEACRVLGYTRDELLNMYVTDIDPDLLLEHWHELWHNIKAHSSLVMESRHRTKNGRIFPVEISATYFKYDGREYDLALVRDITVRKQAQQKVAELAAIVQSSGDAIIGKTLDGTIISWNKGAEKIYGYTANEMIGQSISTLFPPERINGLPHILDKIRAGEHIEHYETTRRRKDGQEIHLALTISPIRDTDDNIIAASTIGHDITAHKQAEQEHLDHLQFLESLDQVNQAIQKTNDLDQMMSNVLEAVLSIFGCDRAGLVFPCDPQAPFWHVPMERTQPAYPGALAMKLEIPTDSDVARTFQIMRSANGPVKFGPGSEYPLPPEVSERFGFQSFIGMALHPKIGKPWEFVLHQCAYPRVWTPQEERLFQEIGQRLADGLTSLLSYRSLRESEEKYRSLILKVQTAIVLYDGQGQILTSNPMAQRLFGQSEDQLLGKNLADPAWHFLKENGAVMPIADHPVSRVLASQQPLRDYVVGIYRPDQNETTWALVNAEPEYSEAGVIERIIVSFIDITERKQAEQERLDHLWFLESMDQINRAIQGTNDLEQMMIDVLDTLLSIFACDRT
ncbi:MAG: PAS domain S-box protein, partial [Anaerolineales bacterium]|nr:PAS domain S-box protein [Anaerolineales bacterium]